MFYFGVWEAFCCCGCYCLSRTSLSETENWRPRTFCISVLGKTWYQCELPSALGTIRSFPCTQCRQGGFLTKSRRNSAHSKKVYWSKQAHLLASCSLTLRSHCLSLIRNIDIWIMVTKLAWYLEPPSHLHYLHFLVIIDKFMLFPACSDMSTV